MTDQRPTDIVQPPEPKAAPRGGPLPAIYLGHGAPPLLEEAAWMRELEAWSASLPRPS